MEAELRAEGLVAPRDADYDRWDLELRGGLLGPAHVRMAIEEHGTSKQLVRFRVCPRCSPLGGVLTLPFAMLAAGAALDCAGAACAMTCGKALLVAVRTFGECDAAIAVVHRKLQAAPETTPFATIPPGPVGFDAVFQPGKKPAVFIPATRVAAGHETPVLAEEKNS